MIIHNQLIQGSFDWLQVRLGKFGGTDAYTVSVNGSGLKTLALKKASEIITGRSSDTYTNADMERGNAFESTARSAYEMTTGNLVTQVGYIEKDQFIGVSPDGLIADDGLIEIKCPKDEVFVKFLFEKSELGIKAIPTKYYWQMMHQIYVSERKWCDFVLFNDNLDRIDVTRVERDEKAIEKLETGLKEGITQVQKILEKVQ